MKNQIKFLALALITATAFVNAFGQAGADFFASGAGGFSINLPKDAVSVKEIVIEEATISGRGNK